MTEIIQNIGDHFGEMRIELLIAWIVCVLLPVGAVIYSYWLTSGPRITIQGDPGTKIPKGFRVQTARGVRFYTIEGAKIGRRGKATVKVREMA